MNPSVTFRAVKPSSESRLEHRERNSCLLSPCTGPGLCTAARAVERAELADSGQTMEHSAGRAAALVVLEQCCLQRAGQFDSANN